VTLEKHGSRLLSATGIALLAITLCHPAGAATDPANSEQGGGGKFFAAHDTEGFDTLALALEYLPELYNADSLTGIRYTLRTYTQQNWRREAHQVSLIKRALDPATSNGWQLDAGLSQQGPRIMLTLDGSYHQALAAKTGLDLFVDREWVETRLALDNGIHFIFLGASVDQGLGDHWTVVGLAGRQDFSDGNSRDHFRAKVVFQPWLDSGLTLQGRYRTYHSDTSNVGGVYFNPANYDETLLAAGWRKRIEGWALGLTAGAGQQHINSDPATVTHLLEFLLDSPLRGAQFVRVRGGYTRSASYSGPNYGYSYLQGEWIIRF
jgi:hypothetical protein